MSFLTNPSKWAIYCNVVTTWVESGTCIICSTDCCYFFVLQVGAENLYTHELLNTTLIDVQVNIISLSSAGTATWSFSKETGKKCHFLLQNLPLEMPIFLWITTFHKNTFLKRYVYIFVVISVALKSWLNRRGWVAYICFCKLDHHWFRYWLVAC